MRDPSPSNARRRVMMIVGVVRAFPGLNASIAIRHSSLVPGPTVMVLLEFSVTPLGEGESVSRYVARCVELVAASGLDYRLHAMGTIVEGELDQVLDLMRRSIEA